MASRLRQIALNNNAGAFIDILATGPTRQVEMMEDEAAATQGLQVKSLLDNFVTVNTFTFPSEPLTIPNILRYPAGGPLIGMNAQGVAGNFNFRAADKLVSARSNGGAGTTLRFIEND
jgi:hypothetical protein